MARKEGKTVSQEVQVLFTEHEDLLLELVGKVAGECWPPGQKKLMPRVVAER